MKALSPTLKRLWATTCDVEGNFVEWQQIPNTWLGYYFPELIINFEGREVFTGVLFVHLKGQDVPEKSEFKFKLSPEITITTIIDQLWGSNIKRGVLTGYHRDIVRLLRPIFCAEELGVRANSAAGVSGANGIVQLDGEKVAYVEDGTELDTGEGWSLLVADGVNYIREDVAGMDSHLRRSLAYTPFSHKGWRLGIQSFFWITNPDDVAGVVADLEPWAEKMVMAANYDPRHTLEAIEMTTTEEYLMELLDLNPLMEHHPLENWHLSDHCARTIFDAVTTGSPPFVQGFSVIPHSGDGVVLPAGQQRLEKDDVYIGGRYPSDNPECTFLVEAIDEGPLAELLAGAETFQNRLIVLKQTAGPAFFSKGYTVVIPVNLWPEKFADCVMICGSEDIKAAAWWRSPHDVAMTKGTAWVCTVEEGYLTAVNWQFAGSAAAIEKAAWKKAGGDWDGDQMYLMPFSAAPNFGLAVANTHEQYHGLLENPKLPKVFTFGSGSRRNRLQDSIVGGKLVGIAANCLLIMLSTDPEEWDELADIIGAESIFDKLHYYGYITNVNVPKRVKLLRVLGFIIKIGTDCFKTNLDASGGLNEWAKVADGIYLTLRGLPAYRLITCNPSKSWQAFKDNAHLPIYAEDEPTFGIADTLMKKCLVDGVGMGQWKLVLPDYMYLGARAEMFKWFAPQPVNQSEIEWCRAVRKTVREELSRRSMADISEWISFKETFLKPLVARAMTTGAIVTKWARRADGKFVAVSSFQFPDLVGMSDQRAAQLLWWAFHEEGEQKCKGRSKPLSAAPVVWLFPDEVKEIVEHMPGMITYQDEFELPVTGLAYCEVALNQAHEVTAKLVKQKREVGLGETAVEVYESRIRLIFADGQYLTLPIEAPIISGHFELTLRLDGKKVMGEFVRLEGGLAAPKAVSMMRVGEFEVA